MADTVEEFLNADFVIPKSGGDMLTGWTGTKEEADEIVRKLRERMEDTVRRERVRAAALALAEKQRYTINPKPHGPSSADFHAAIVSIDASDEVMLSEENLEKIRGEIKHALSPVVVGWMALNSVDTELAKDYVEKFNARVEWAVDGIVKVLKGIKE